MPSTLIIGLSAPSYDTKICEDKPRSLNKIETIKRRHSFQTMMKFLSSRKNLFTITESRTLEDQIASSFTMGSSPAKPTQRKIRKGKKKSNVKQTLANALSIVTQNSKEQTSTYTPTTGTEALKDHSSGTILESSQNSITTCSTASLTDDDSDVYEKRQAKEEQRRSKTKKEKRSGTDLLLPKEPPLIRGEMRWDEQSEYLGEEHYMYAGVHRKSCDIAPVCPVRTYD